MELSDDQRRAVRLSLRQWASSRGYRSKIELAYVGVVDLESKKGSDKRILCISPHHFFLFRFDQKKKRAEVWDLALSSASDV